MFEGNALADMGAFELNPRWETELLAVERFVAAPHTVVTAPAGLSHGAGTRLAAAAAGASVTYRVPVPEAGRYAITARVRSGGDAGTWLLEIGDAAGGPYATVGVGQDGYASAEGWQTIVLGTVDVVAAAQKLFRFTVTGKNAASNGYNLGLDYLMVTKQ